MFLLGFTFDYFDGYVARKFKMESNLGNILDKFVDKLNQNNILLFLYYKYNVSLFYYKLFLFRECLMFLSRYYGYKKVTSSTIAKVKTFIFPFLLPVFYSDINMQYIFLYSLTIMNFLTLLF
jgi:phosphatidylglycerophosphate synthase